MYLNPGYNLGVGIVLSLLALLPQQDDTAAAAFKKIEKTIENATTVSVKVEGQPHTHRTVRSVARRPTAFGMKVYGTLLLKEGNKARLALTTRVGPKRRRLVSVVSDGTKAKFLPDRTARDTPEQLNAFLTTVLTRAGFLLSTTMMSRILSAPDLEELPDLKPSLKVSDVKYGDDDGEAKTLTYNLTFGGGDEPIGVRLWYDPKTFRLFKRTLRVRDKDRPRLVTETYESFVINGDIPDETFNLPADNIKGF